MDNLGFQQLVSLLDSVFRLRDEEQGLAILVDLPGGRAPDHEVWRDRRAIAEEWSRTLAANRHRLPFSDIVRVTYPNVGSNNGDLPLAVTVDGQSVPLSDLLRSSSVVLAPTELSATAPLKLLAREHGFRGATLPGFTRAMLPVLALDYERVHDRVMEFKNRMDDAEGMSLSLESGGVRYESFFDFRHRAAHASGGLMREPGMVGNLPSGEAYIVPYEGERDADPSRTAGALPVQFGDELVVYRLAGNRAVEVLTDGPRSVEERGRLAAEPAYGNMAEVGIGVLGEWGVEAVGSTLLDEKLGLHIAFGRSDHFGGVTGPASFRDPANVIHIDRVYVESTQPGIRIREATFVYPDASREPIIRSGRYTV
jgi:hypothetical protein